MGWLFSFTAAFFAFAVPGGTGSSCSPRCVLPAHPILRTTGKRSQNVNAKQHAPMLREHLSAARILPSPLSAQVPVAPSPV